MSETTVSLRIRPATAADQDRLIPLINDAFGRAETFMTGPRIDPARMIDAMKKGTILMAEDDDGVLLASIYTEIRGEGHGYIGMLAVDPARQGGGIGRRMMEAAEEHLRANGCKYVDIRVLSLRPELPPIYRRMGFIETGTEPFEYPHPIAGGAECHCIVMSKPLASLA